MSNLVEYRELECTVCCNELSEKGAPVQLAAGGVTMRACPACGEPTVHMLLTRHVVEVPEIVEEEE